MNLLVYHVRRVKDISWLRMNCEIYRLAATYGHVALLPAVNEMERESVAGVLCASAEAAIKNRHHIGERGIERWWG